MTSQVKDRDIKGNVIAGSVGGTTSAIGYILCSEVIPVIAAAEESVAIGTIICNGIRTSVTIMCGANGILVIVGGFAIGIGIY